MKMGNRGSVGVFLVFLIALGVGGFFYKVMSNVVSVAAADAPAVLTSTVQYQTLFYFWDWIILIVILIGLISWFLAALSKSRAQQY